MLQLILADKSDLFRRSISSVLSREGYEVIAVETGQRVLGLVQTMKPAAIILDMETTDPSGLETLLLLKRDPHSRRMPVILVSRDSAPSVVSNAFKIGVEGFMLKPIDVNQLLKTLSGLQRLVPQLNSPIDLSFGNRARQRATGSLRFIDQFGQVYLDKVVSEEDPAAEVWDPTAEDEDGSSGVAPIGSLGTMSFEAGKGKLYQRVLMIEENEQGLALYPAGDPGASETPDLLKIPVNLKGRYLVPGSFMKLAEVVLLHGKGLILAGLSDEPKFNSPIQITIYPPALGTDGGIALKGRITSSRAGAGGQFEVEVELTEAPGPNYVYLLAEVISGRPYRPTPSKVAVPL